MFPPFLYYMKLHMLILVFPPFLYYMKLHMLILVCPLTHYAIHYTILYTTHYHFCCRMTSSCWRTTRPLKIWKRLLWPMWRSSPLCPSSLLRYPHCVLLSVWAYVCVYSMCSMYI